MKMRRKRVLYSVSKKEMSKFLNSCKILTDFQKFFAAGKRLKFSTKRVKRFLFDFMQIFTHFIRNFILFAAVKEN